MRSVPSRRDMASIFGQDCPLQPSTVRWSRRRLRGIGTVAPDSQTRRTTCTNSSPLAAAEVTTLIALDLRRKLGPAEVAIGVDSGQVVRQVRAMAGRIPLLNARRAQRS